MSKSFSLVPIGWVHRQQARTWIDVEPAFADGLLGLDGFSHIHVLYWFHENDTPSQRAVLQVHPRKDSKNPLTGVFATHSPLRPNLLALTLCRILEISGTRIAVADLDARDGSPVIDIKCYIPYSVAPEAITVPTWV
ncbi:MAG: tRNA (N6-threonylcarbamoyladenosine(37)-N6)-methyltransferase TrmO [Pseudomonadota bacterium]